MVRAGRSQSDHMFSALPHVKISCTANRLFPDSEKAYPVPKSDMRKAATLPGTTIGVFCSKHCGIKPPLCAMEPNSPLTRISPMLLRASIYT